MRELIDTIDRKKLWYDITHGDTFLDAMTLANLHDIVREQPTVDSVSVVHGHWIYDPNGMDWNLGAWRCSKCGCKNNNIGGDERINPLLFAGSKYCPNCGCKMDEDTEREGPHD